MGRVFGWWLKDDAPCCLMRADKLGRLPVGYCSPGCVRRGWTPVQADTVDIPIDIPIVTAPLIFPRPSLTLVGGGQHLGRVL